MKDRTKVEISTALTTLLAKKAIDDITVREIGYPETDLLHSNPGIANMSVEKQNFIFRAYSRVFVGLFLDWVSNGMKAKDLDCFSDACILVEGGIEGALKKT